jgi:hypothetical protein
MSRLPFTCQFKYQRCQIAIERFAFGGNVTKHLTQVLDFARRVYSLKFQTVGVLPERVYRCLQVEHADFQVANAKRDDARKCINLSPSELDLIEHFELQIGKVDRIVRHFQRCQSSNPFIGSMVQYMSCKVHANINSYPLAFVVESSLFALVLKPIPCWEIDEARTEQRNESTEERYSGGEAWLEISQYSVRDRKWPTYRDGCGQHAAKHQSGDRRKSRQARIWHAWILTPIHSPVERAFL